MLALDKEFLPAFDQHEIYAAIGTPATCFKYAKPLQSKRLANEQFELAPRHPIERTRGLGLCDAADERLTGSAAPGRHTRADKAQDRDDVLRISSEAGSGTSDSSRSHASWVKGRRHRLCPAVEDQIGDQRKDDAAPPGQHRNQFQ